MTAAVSHNKKSSHGRDSWPFTFTPTHIQVNQQREKGRLQICEKRASYFQIFMICNFAAKLFQLFRPQDF